VRTKHVGEGGNETDFKRPGTGGGYYHDRFVIVFRPSRERARRPP